MGSEIKDPNGGIRADGSKLMDLNLGIQAEGFEQRSPSRMIRAKLSE